MDTSGLQLHAIVEMKKMHPCGGKEWKVTRVGMDIKLQCCKCQREISMPRVKFNKQIKKIITNDGAE